jgi:hypothetical protein
LGKSPFEAKLGVHTWLNGAYWLRQDSPQQAGRRFVVNAHDIGKKQVPPLEASVEGDLVYPILPHTPQHPGSGIPEAELKRTHPRAFQYFNQLRSVLTERSGYKKFIKPNGGPFYAVYNIGSYTFRSYHVVWREQASTLQACVVSRAEDERLIIPDHKLTILGFDSGEDAHFICALLNSSPIQSAVKAYSIQVQISTHVASFIALVRFDERQGLHREIVQIGRACHEATESGDSMAVTALEQRLDQRCAEIWSINALELAQMRESLVHTGPNLRDSDDED